jgi:hypothetical protein
MPTAGSIGTTRREPVLNRPAENPETAGFGDVQMLDNWTDAPVSPDTANITFVAQKPS